MIAKWSGVVAVGGGPKLRLILTRPNQPYMQLHTTQVPGVRYLPYLELILFLFYCILPGLVLFSQDNADVAAIAWALLIDAEGMQLMLVFASQAILYILEVDTGKYHGTLIGHGGVNFFCSFYSDLIAS
jgi:hypothetical protein